jgi:membrane-associated protein
MIDLLSITFRDLLNPEFYINNGGLYLFLFIIFAETGLFAGFFLPGDSMLFVAGIYSNNLAAYMYDTGSDFGNVMLLVALTVVAGVIGNFVGYWFGAKSGPYLFKRKDTFFFRKKYLYQAKEFYEKNGGGAIVIARFLPIIRTFAPIIAGVVGMEKKKFSFYNIVGCIAWAGSLIAAGHYLDKIVRDKFGVELKEHLEIIILIIVAFTTAPVVYKIFFNKKKSDPGNGDAVTPS